MKELFKLLVGYGVPDARLNLQDIANVQWCLANLHKYAQTFDEQYHAVMNELLGRWYKLKAV